MGVADEWLGQGGAQEQGAEIWGPGTSSLTAPTAPSVLAGRFLDQQESY